MAFLRLNGLTIPVANFTEIPREIGSRSVALDGMPLVDRQAIKREWKGETPPTQRQLATAVRGVLLGLGDNWPFDSDIYSAKGVNASGTPAYTLHSLTAGDGDAVKDSTWPQAKYVGSISVDAAITNILGADSRDAENAPTGYTAVNGATLAADTSNYWQGAKSVKVSTDAVGADQEGVKTDAVDPGAGSATKTYTGSVYLKGDAGSEAVSVYLRDVTNAVNGTATVVALESGVWKRIQCSITIGGVDCRSMELYVIENSADSDIDFYCDGFQIEETEDDVMMTGWVDGSRTAESIEVPGSHLVDSQSEDMTVNIWVKSTPNNHSADRTMFVLSSSSVDPNNRISLVRVGASKTVRFQTVDSAGAVTDNVDYTLTPLWLNAWYMFTVVIRNDPGSGEYTKELYMNGSLVDYSSPAAWPTLSLIDTLEIGHNGASDQWIGGLLEELLIVPYAATAAQITAWYGMTAATAGLPRAFIDGDAVRDASWVTEVIGKIGSIKTQQAGVGGNWETNMERIAFSLEEC